jgi:hypothetical protein
MLYNILENLDVKRNVVMVSIVVFIWEFSAFVLRWSTDWYFLYVFPGGRYCTQSEKFAEADLFLRKSPVEILVNTLAVLWVSMIFFQYVAGRCQNNTSDQTANRSLYHFNSNIY